MAGKSVKIGVGLVGGVIAIVIVVAVGVYLFSGDIIKAAVEELGPKMTQSEVKLASADLSATSGEGRLEGLFVGNPKGFATESAFRLGEIAIKVDIGTITGDTIVINDILIRAPQVTYELGDGGSNIDAIQRNVESYVGPSGSAAKSGDDGPGKKLIIENLRIQEGRVNVSAAFLAGKAMGAGLPAIHLKDIGKEKGGATAGEVVEQVLAALEGAVSKAVQPLGLDKLQSAAEGMAKGATDAATKAISAGTSGSGETVKGATDTIKGLFGK